MSKPRQQPIKQNPPCPRCPSSGPVAWSGFCFNCGNCGRLWLIETRQEGAARLVECPVPLYAGCVRSKS